MTNIKTLEQKRQEALDKANRLKKQIEKQVNGQKFVLGGMQMAIAEAEPDRIPQILADMDKYVTRKPDIKRLEGLRAELASKVASKPSMREIRENKAVDDEDMSQFYSNN